MDYKKSDLDKVIKYYNLDYQDRGKYYQIRSYCHHHDGDGGYKLYAYFDENLSVSMYCYSNCGSMNLVGFIMRYREIEYPQAMSELNTIIGGRKIEGFFSQDLYNPAVALKKNENEYKDVSEISAKLLERYHPYAYGGWIDEGISAETQKKFGIRYSISENKIIIPQLDINGRLIGVRGRSLDQYEIDNFGKYRPVRYKGKVLSYPTSLNLYGLFQNKRNILKAGKVIIFESEKSVMQLDTIMNGNGNGVALSGSSISSWQINELSKLGINEIIVGLDKDYNDEQSRKTRAEMIVKMFKRMLLRFNVSVLFDDCDGLLGYKDSPTDKGSEPFYKLMRSRKVMS